MENNISSADLANCELTETKIKNLLRRDYYATANDYGYPSEVSPIALAASIHQSCRMDPLTKILLKDPAVITYFTLKKGQVPAEKSKTPSGIR